MIENIVPINSFNKSKLKGIYINTTDYSKVQKDYENTIYFMDIPHKLELNISKKMFMSTMLMKFEKISRLSKIISEIFMDKKKTIDFANYLVLMRSANINYPKSNYLKALLEYGFIPEMINHEFAKLIHGYLYNYEIITIEADKDLKDDNVYRIDIHIYDKSMSCSFFKNHIVLSYLFDRNTMSILDLTYIH